MDDLIVQPEADDEYHDIVAAFESERAMTAFEAGFREVTSFIRDHPSTGIPEGGGYFRRPFFKRSPYAVIYRIVADTVVVVAVYQQSREPGYWRDRE